LAELSEQEVPACSRQELAEVAGHRLAEVELACSYDLLREVLAVEVQPDRSQQGAAAGHRCAALLPVHEVLAAEARCPYLPQEL
jgi:hypothetical protein